LALGAVPDRTVDWQALSDPANYLGETKQMIDAVLERAHKLSC
jgi:hypothetical protein